MSKYKTELIKQPKREDDQVKYEDGQTSDIIKTVLYADKKAAWYVNLFAPTLQKHSIIETCRNIWQFVKMEIPYTIDPPGVQWIKSPGRLWADKSGDCKSFSIFTGACLRVLGIPYGYRFASYSESTTPTHVYVFVPLENGKEIILDSVWTGPFNTQKSFTYKQDFKMTKISYLGSVRALQPRKRQPGELILTKPVDQISEGEMDLLIARQRLEIEKANSEAVGGPFNFQIPKYDKAIAVVNECLANVNNPDHICGIGQTMIDKAIIAGKKKSAGGFFKKIGTGIKKGVKALSKVVTAPVKLIAKGVLEIYLPKASMAFLYLFAAENMLPDKMRVKRKKAEKLKNFIVNKIGMKEKHFMGIVRNALTKQLKKSPESFLAAGLKNNSIKGIGAITPSIKIDLEAGKSIYSNEWKAAKKEVKKSTRKKNLSKFMNSGVVKAIISAITWIINSLGGRSEGVEYNVNDLPDVTTDAGNAFNFENLNTDFSNISTAAKAAIKETATELIEEGADFPTAVQTIRKKFGGLNTAQVNELGEEVASGYDPLSDQDSSQLATQIKNQGTDSLDDMSSGGRMGPGMCNC